MDREKGITSASVTADRDKKDVINEIINKPDEINKTDEPENKGNRKRKNIHPNESTAENKMGRDPIPKVLLNMGIPIIISMVLQACYNIVDSMFVARMHDAPGIPDTGELAVNALTLAFPVQMLIVAFGIGTGVGVNAALSTYLGMGNRKKAGETAGNGVTLGILIYLVFAVAAIFGIKPYLASQTSDKNIFDMGVTYLSICTFLSLGNILYGIYEKLLQAAGKTIYSTIAQISGAVTNIILDPVMIYGLLGVPEMGIAGAAAATVIGQFVSLFIAMAFHYGKNKEVPSGLRYLKLNKKIVKRIYRVGVPAIIMQALMSFMTYGVNIIFGAVSTAAVTAYGIFYKIQQFILFAAFGIRDAITPLTAYNRGMGSQKRVKQTVFFGALYTCIIMLAGTIVLELFGRPLAEIFGLSSHTEDLCVRAMKIIAVSFVPAGISVSMQGVFQGTDKGIDSLIVSLLRLLVIPLPAGYILSKAPGAENIIWWAFPAAEVIAAGAAVICMAYEIRHSINKLQENARLNA